MAIEKKNRLHILGCSLHGIGKFGCAAEGWPPYLRAPGEVPEWSNGPDSKSGVPVRVPGVRIPPSPPSPSLSARAFSCPFQTVYQVHILLIVNMLCEEMLLEEGAGWASRACFVP